jgi:hypothetical protein
MVLHNTGPHQGSPLETVPHARASTHTTSHFPAFFVLELAALLKQNKQIKTQHNNKKLQHINK